MIKKILLSAAVLANATMLISCSGTFNAAEATNLEIWANGINVQVASAAGNNEYDALVEACSGAVYSGKLDSCSFGDVMLTFTIGDEKVVLYPCTDEDCEYMVKGDLDGEKCEYIKIDEDDRKAIFDFINDYAY